MVQISVNDDGFKLLVATGRKFDLLVNEGLNDAGRSNVFAFVFPSRDMGKVVVITQRFAFGSLILGTEVTTAGFVTGESVATHEFAKLQEVGHATGFFQRLVEAVTATTDHDIFPEFLAELRDALDGFGKTVAIAGHAALVPEEETEFTVEVVHSALAIDREKLLGPLLSLTRRIHKGGVRGVGALAAELGREVRAQGVRDDEVPIGQALHEGGSTEAVGTVIGEIRLAEHVEARDVAHEIVVYPETTHGVVNGGYAALAAVILLGVRNGKYIDGKIKPILGHSMPLATIGVMLLFLGWFGFNGGSVLSADPILVSFVFVTTALAGFAGGIAAIFTSWVLLKKPDLSMSLNGMLAGLVGITAGADSIAPWAAVLVGFIAGVLVVLSVLVLDKAKIDDPVGAVSVHGICGTWGTLAVGIFGSGAFLTQLIGTVSISVFAFISSLIIFGVVKAVFGLRVSAEEEEEGLDIGEHGQEAYPDFVANK